MLLDVESVCTSGFAAIKKAQDRSPNTKVMLLSTDGSDAFIARALQHGARGCLSVPLDQDQCLRAIRVIHEGELWITRKVLADLLTALLLAPVPHTPEAHDPLRDNLSEREYEIVYWMQQGMTNKEIGRRLAISDMTVKTHVHNIFRKLNVSGRLRLFQQLNRPQTLPAFRRQNGHSADSIHPAVPSFMACL